MKKVNHKRYHKVWLSALFLFICVALTAIILVNRFGFFYMDDSGAIDIVGDVVVAEVPGEETADKGKEQTETKESSGENDSKESDDVSESETETAYEIKPGFVVSDDQGVWKTKTLVELFSISYENDEERITVASDNGEKVIAPGTELSYTFKLKNTGNVPMKYTVTIDAFVTPESMTIPIVGRIKRYDNKWIVGDEESYGDMAALNDAQDNSDLGVGKYTYYTLTWCWPFESGDDVYDTMLGNMALKEDITFTAVINTYATVSENGGGLDGVKTGDQMQVILFISLAVGALILIIILCIYKVVDKIRSRKEAENIGED